tara:strand:+ start:596 stop:799 length:204 start_codon:yes stop_codon:yes gene_type:complete
MDLVNLNRLWDVLENFGWYTETQIIKMFTDWDDVLVDEQYVDVDTVKETIGMNRWILVSEFVNVVIG